MVLIQLRWKKNLDLPLTIFLAFLALVQGDAEHASSTTVSLTLPDFSELLL